MLIQHKKTHLEDEVNGFEENHPISYALAKDDNVLSGQNYVRQAIENGVEEYDEKPDEGYPLFVYTDGINRMREGKEQAKRLLEELVEIERARRRSNEPITKADIKDFWVVFNNLFGDNKELFLKIMMVDDKIGDIAETVVSENEDEEEEVESKDEENDEEQEVMNNEDDTLKIKDIVDSSDNVPQSEVFKFWVAYSIVEDEKADEIRGRYINDEVDDEVYNAVSNARNVRGLMGEVSQFDDSVEKTLDSQVQQMVNDYQKDDVDIMDRYSSSSDWL